jgi:disulfide bond formation protein DsbB
MDNVARRRPLLLRLAGGGLLVATGAIHLDLYLTGYRSIPTIGSLFLLQIVTAFVLAAAVAATRNRLAAAAGALFALSTLGGYLLTVWFGLFGFKEVRTTAGIVAGLIEVGAFAVLAVTVFASAPELSARQSPDRRRLGARSLGWAVGGSSLVALVLLGAAVASAGGVLQVTYDNHPLYTYVGDAAPGQAHGNDINLNGGEWHEVTATSGG